MHVRTSALTARASGYFGSIALSVILLYLVAHLVDWQVGWITPAWSDVVWAVNLSLEFSIVANALCVVYDRGWFRHPLLIACSGLALQAVYWLYAVFPFDFGTKGTT